MTRVAPGQLWRWDFDVHDGWWMFELVTESRRHSIVSDGVATLERGDTFMIVVVDDSGPHEFDLPTQDGLGQTICDLPARWHVVLIKNQLAWIKHDDLLVSTLITDVP